MAIVILVYTPVIMGVIGDTDATTWATVLVLVGIAYAFVASWFVRRHYAALADRSTSFLFGLANVPWVISFTLAFSGAASWAFWLGALASVLLHGWWAWTTRTAATPRDPHAVGASLDNAGGEPPD